MQLPESAVSKRNAWMDYAWKAIIPYSITIEAATRSQIASQMKSALSINALTKQFCSAIYKQSPKIIPF